MNANRNSQLGHSNNSKRAIRRKKSYFWNTKTPCETIDNSELSENGTGKQIVNTNDKPIASEPCKSNIFSKILKKVNCIFVKSLNVNQGCENKVNTEKSIKHSQSMMELQRNYDKQLTDGKPGKRRSLFTPTNRNTILLPKLPEPVTSSQQLNGDKNELNDWKITLLNELDATQHGIKNDKSNLFDLRVNDNADCNELAVNTLQPSGMENNRNANQRFASRLDAKLGVIPRKTMIDDWLHYNDNIPESASSEMPVSSYLQHYHAEAINDRNADKLFSKVLPLGEKKKSLQEGTSLLSAQLKKDGKEKHDHIRERLEVAAARRNAIKTNRLKEQMDTALFETIHMLRESNDINNQQQQMIMQQQNIEDWLHAFDKKSDRKTYLSSASEATISTSLSNDYYLNFQDHSKRQGLEEDFTIW